MLVAIVNHNCNDNAIALRQGFLPLAPVKLIDSGSTIEAGQRPYFDDLLPNVYYSGLLNRVYEHAAVLEESDPVLFICSDVVIAEPARLIDLLRDVFWRDPSVRVWAPSARGEGAHVRHMIPKGDQPRRVSYVDGYCFAARKGLLRRVCPIDLRINALGWGIETHLGYLASTGGGCVVVDDRIEVMHPADTGYDTGEARRQYNAWRKSMRRLARLFHYWSHERIFAEGLGLSVLRSATEMIYRMKPS